MNEIKEYKFDNNFSFYIQKIHEITEVPKFVVNYKEEKAEHKLINSYHEYFSFSKLVFENKILLEDNLFELIEFNNIIKLFSQNKLDKRNIYKIDGLDIFVNEDDVPYKLKISDEEKINISLSSFECFNLSSKLHKMLILIEPIPYSNK